MKYQITLLVSLLLVSCASIRDKKYYQSKKYEDRKLKIIKFNVTTIPFEKRIKVKWPNGISVECINRSKNKLPLGSINLRLNNEHVSAYPIQNETTQKIWSDDRMDIGYYHSKKKSLNKNRFEGEKQVIELFHVNGEKKNNLNIDCIALERPEDLLNNVTNNYRSEFPFQTNKKKILLLGGSTFVNNWKNLPVARSIHNFLDLEAPNKFYVINGSSWSHTLLDHAFNWNHIQNEHHRGIFRDRHLYNNQFEFDPLRIPRFDFGFKDLKSDLIVISPMWNSFYIKYLIDSFNSKERIHVNKDGIPLFTEMYLKYMDYHLDSKVNNKVIVEKIRDRLNKKQLKKYKAVSVKKAFELHYEKFLDYLLVRILKTNPSQKILFVNLPLAINENNSKSIQRYYFEKSKNYIGDDYTDPKVLFLKAKTQRKVLKKVSMKNKNFYFLDLAQKHDAFLQKIKKNQITKLNLMEHDLMHFKINGSVWAAGHIKDKINDIF